MRVPEPGLEARIRALERWQASHVREYEMGIGEFERFRKQVLEHQEALTQAIGSLKQRLTLLVIVALVVVLGANAGLAEVLRALLVK